MTYTFLLVSSNGSTPVSEVAPCPDREAARQEALEVLLRNPERPAVEVWDENERVWIVANEQRAYA